MRSLALTLLVAAGLGIGAPAALAKRAKVPSSIKLPLVQAQCPGPPPGPCSPLVFTSGTATVRSARQPAPTCPKTGTDPSENNTGDVVLVGVNSAGAPFTGALSVEVVQRTTFASDPNGNCVLATVQLEIAALSGTLTCTRGRCTGRLVPLGCLPKECADTPIVSELSSLVVKDDTGQRLATPGLIVTPAPRDAP